MSRLANNRRLVVVAFGLLAFLPSTAGAQGFLIDLYAGAALPTSRLNDLTDPGFSGGLGFGYLFGRSMGVRADFAGEWLNGEEPAAIPSSLNVDPEFVGRDVRLYHYDAAIVLNATDPDQTRVILAIEAGAGATTIQFRGAEPRPESSTRFTIPIGIGIGYRLAEEVALFIRGRFYLMFTDSATFGGSTWSSFPVWGGIGIRTG